MDMHNKLAPMADVRKMSDDAYCHYTRSLTPSAYERECARDYIETEYEVRPVDVNGDVIDVLHHATEAEALAQFNEYAANLTAGMAVVLEKAVKHYGGGERTLQDCDYATLATAGDAAALAAGGWDQD